MTERVVGIGIGREGVQVAGAPADCASIGREHIKDPNRQQRERNSPCNELPRPARLLGQWSRSFETAERQYRKHHPSKNSLPMMRRERGAQRCAVTRTWSWMDEK